MNALEKLCSLLESKYDLKIEGSIDHLSFIKEYYSEKSKKYYLNESEYQKAYLISEVARLMILREIQPKPKGKKKKK